MAEKMNYPVARIRVDHGHWKVPSEPVRSMGMNGNFTMTRVSRCDGDAFVLAPSWGAYLFGLLFVGFGTVILSLYVRAFLFDDQPMKLPEGFWPTVGMIVAYSFGIVLGFMAIVMSMTLMTQTTRFDHATGMKTRRVFFQTRSELPLTDIVAVQCLYAGRGSTKGGSYDILQLNLVVATGNEPRICLTTNPTETWVRETATDLAEFLGVPLVDQIAQTRAVYEANRFKWW